MTRSVTPNRRRTSRGERRDESVRRTDGSWLAVPVAGVRPPRGLSGDAAVAALAAEQHGVASTAQLGACGLTAAAIAHRVAAGRLIRIHRGVYAVGHGGLGFEGQAMAAVLALGRGAVVSHRSSARLQGLLPPGTPACFGVAPVDVTVVGGRNVRARPGIRRHRSTGLDRRDLRWVGPIPVMGAARTALEIAEEGDRRLTERVLAAGLRRRLTTEENVRSLLGRSRGRAGLGVVAGLIVAGPAFDRSVAERLLLELLRRAGLPEPRMNGRAGRFEVDGLWSDLRVVVEFQSFTFHGDRDAFRTDHRKSAALQALGYDVVPVIWEDLTGAPEVVVATVAAVLAIARERLRVGAVA